jgi:hypothetical protein
VAGSPTGISQPSVISLGQRPGALAIEGFADDVRVSSVARCLLDEVQQDPAHQILDIGSLRLKALCLLWVKNRAITRLVAHNPELC